MSLVKDELQTATAPAWTWRFSRYAVELAVSAIVVVTLTATSPDLADTPLAVAFSTLSEVLLLVACLSLTDWILGRLGVGERYGLLVRHAATILVAGFLNELLEFLPVVAFSGGVGSLAGWLPELLEGCLYAGLFWGVCLAVRAAMGLARGDERPDSLPARHPGPLLPAGLLGMLPATLRQDIGWMKAEGNYVAVHGTQDHQLVNYVFSRAVEEARPLGLQVHRSYWVAFDALERIDTQEGRTWVVLRGGQRLPVSRSYLPAVKQAMATRG